MQGIRGRFVVELGEHTRGQDFLLASGEASYGSQNGGHPPLGIDVLGDVLSGICDLVARSRLPLDSETSRSGPRPAVHQIRCGSDQPWQS
jgi:hypothetical protein